MPCPVPIFKLLYLVFYCTVTLIPLELRVSNTVGMQSIEEADKTSIAPGVTAGQVRRFRAALIRPLPAPRPRRTTMRPH